MCCILCTVDKGKLLDELKALTSGLVHSEAYFTKNTNETLQVSRLHYYVWCALILAAADANEESHGRISFNFSDDDDLPKFIPNTICEQHYVAFRVVLRGYVCSDLLYALKGKGGRIGALVDSHISVSSAW